MFLSTLHALKIDEFCYIVIRENERIGGLTDEQYFAVILVQVKVHV